MCALQGSDPLATDAELAVLAQCYEAGLTIREIAAQQDLDRTTCRPAVWAVAAGV
jgi:hypothetical protein